MGDNVPAIIPFDTLERMAAVMAHSKLFGAQSVDEALALMLVAQAEGMHPASAAAEFDIIKGRPARKTHAVLARFQAAGGTVAWKELTDTKVTGVFTHKQGGTVEVTWDMARAKQAELAGKDMWKKYPRQMLRARCIAEGVRLTYPGALNGMMVVEEAQDLPPIEKDMGKADQIDPWTDDLKAAAQAAALRGIKAYGDWWKLQDADWRDLAVSTKFHHEMKTQALMPPAERQPEQTAGSQDEPIDVPVIEKPVPTNAEWNADYDAEQAKEAGK
jgi:hypothetical protein